MVVAMVVRAARVIITAVMVVMAMLLSGVPKRRVLYTGVREGPVSQQVSASLCHPVCEGRSEGGLILVHLPYTLVDYYR